MIYSSSNGVIIYSVVGVIVFLIILCVIVFLVVRKMKKKKDGEKPSELRDQRSKSKDQFQKNR